MQKRTDYQKPGGFGKLYVPPHIKVELQAKFNNLMNRQGQGKNPYLLSDKQQSVFRNTSYNKSNKINNNEYSDQQAYDDMNRPLTAPK